MRRCLLSACCFLGVFAFAQERAPRYFPPSMGYAEELAAHIAWERVRGTGETRPQ